MTQEELMVAVAELNKKIEAKEEVIKTVVDHLEMLRNELEKLHSERFTTIGKFLDPLRRELKLDGISYF